MQHNVYYVFAALLYFLNITGSLAQGTAKLVIDPVSHEYKVEQMKDWPANARVADFDITQTVTPFASRPESMINVHIDFGDNVNLDNIFSIAISIFPECGQGCNALPFAESYLSRKAINITARTVDFVMGGMLPNKSYRLRTFVFGLIANEPCSANDPYVTFFTTSPASSAQKKMLMVINEEWQNTPSVQAKLDQYISDIQTTMPGMTIAKYYIQNNSFAKIALYEYIKQHFLAENISYLFFIGDNASAYSYINLLDDSGNEISSTVVTTFVQYTHPLYKHYTYDPALYDLQTNKYQNYCVTRPQEVREAVFQQRNSLISMGMIIPAPNLTAEAKENYLVNYFTKLHKYRNKDITFSKDVLLTDGFRDEQSAVTLVKANGHWATASTVSFGRPKDLNYSGEDPIWKADYLNKLGNESYEILSVNVHGSPNYQSFGIYKEDINNLTKLNTQLISLSSCNTGFYKSDNYIAGEYLAKGNVMNVHAYADLLFAVLPGNDSFLEYEYRTNGTFTLMADGFTISDAYRHSTGYNDHEVILGDPLVKFHDSGPLPVVLENFDVKKEGKSALLNWSTTSESNSRHFEIERSLNAKKWTQIGKVLAHGESTTSRNYASSDNDPFSGQNLYRLKMLDRDGSFAYSRIVNVTFENANLIYPNPVSDQILFDENLRHSIKSVTIVNASGKVILNNTKIPEAGISVKSFPAGLYVVNILMINGGVEVKRLIVSK